MSDPISEPTKLLCPWNSPGKNSGVGSHSLLQGIFPTQGSNPGLLHCRRLFTSEPAGKPINLRRPLKLKSYCDLNTRWAEGRNKTAAIVPRITAHSNSGELPEAPGEWQCATSEVQYSTGSAFPPAVSSSSQPPEGFRQVEPALYLPLCPPREASEQPALTQWLSTQKIWVGYRRRKESLGYPQNDTCIWIFFCPSSKRPVVCSFHASGLQLWVLLIGAALRQL